MIDWARVAELQAEIGEDGFAEVVALFIEEADEAVETLATGLKPADVEGRLHFIKGSALNLGLTALAELCQEGERRAAAGQGAEVDLNHIVDVYTASRSAYLGGLNLDETG